MMIPSSVMLLFGIFYRGCLSTNVTSESPTNSPSAALKVLPVVSIPSISPNETQHILRVTARIFCATEGSTIFYSIDGAAPQIKVVQGSPILIDTFGPVVLQSYASHPDMTDSAITTKKFLVLERCQRPSFSPMGGTFAGSVVVTLSSGTVGSRIYYNVQAVKGAGTGTGAGSGQPMEPDPPTTSSPWVLSGGTIVLEQRGVIYVTAMAVKSQSDQADSLISTAKFTLLPKAKSPEIRPLASVFTIAASLVFTCATPNATIYYTTDGSAPTQTSLIVESGSTIVIEESGDHIVRAFAVEPDMLPSSVTTKSFSILQRASSPHLVPLPDRTYIGGLSVTPICGDQSTTGGIVYFTTDGKSTPSDKSSHVLCGECILLKAPGRYIVRAFLRQTGLSDSSVFQGMYVLTRPPFEEIRIAPDRTDKGEEGVGGGGGGGGDYVDRFARVEVRSIEKTIITKSNGVTSKYDKHGNDMESVEFFESATCAVVRVVRGRFVVLHNPAGRFDLLGPVTGVLGGRNHIERESFSFSIPDIGTDEIEESGVGGVMGGDVVKEREGEREMGREGEKEEKKGREEGDMLTSNTDIPLRYKNNGRDGSHVKLNSDIERSTTSPSSPLCEVVSSVGAHDKLTGTFFGNVVSQGNVLQESSVHNVHFGVRNGTFFTGYLDSSIPLISQKFESLMSGVGWLVRDGSSYISENISPSGDNETKTALSLSLPLPPSLSSISSDDDCWFTWQPYSDADTESQLRSPSNSGFLAQSDPHSASHSDPSIFFNSQSYSDSSSLSSSASSESSLTSISARSVIGCDVKGKLLLLQIDGSTGLAGEGSGMTLLEVADLAVELGFHSGINLIAGVSMSVNGSVVSLATDACPPRDEEQNGGTENGAEYFKCSGVITGTYACIHSLPTPFPSSSFPSVSPISPPSPSFPSPPSLPSSPSISPPSSLSSPSLPAPESAYPPAAHPTHTPNNWPPWVNGDEGGAGGDDYDSTHHPSSTRDSNTGAMTDNDNLSGNLTLSTASFHSLQDSAIFYRFSSEVLLGLLAASVLVNIFLFARSRKNGKNRHFAEKGMEGGASSLESGPRSQQAHSRHNAEPEAEHSDHGYPDSSQAFSLKSGEGERGGTGSGTGVGTDRDWRKQLSEMKFSIDDSSSEEEGGRRERERGSESSRAPTVFSTYMPQSANEKGYRNNAQEGGLKNKNKGGVLGGLFGAQNNGSSKKTRSTKHGNGSSSEYCQVEVRSDDSDDNYNFNDDRGSARSSGGGRHSDSDSRTNGSGGGGGKGGGGSVRGSVSREEGGRSEERERDSAVNPFHRTR